MNLDSQDHISQTLKSLSVQLGYQRKKPVDYGKRWIILHVMNQLPTMISWQNNYSTWTPTKMEKRFWISSRQHRRCRQCHYSCWCQVSLWKYSFNQREIKLFINICHHSTAVSKPYDANGNIVAESRQENILIPLIISKLRNCFDSSNNKAMAVDVIVNSCCINFCSSKLIEAINSDQGSSTGSESLEDYQVQV